MLMEDRLVLIKQIIEEERSASIEDLAIRLSVSKDTIRRDLMKLEKQKKIKRTHGGALAIEKEALIFDYVKRSSIFSEIKERIAVEAINKLQTNATIILDASTTVEATIKYLESKEIQAITNSLTHALLLAKLPNTTTTILPGTLHKTQLFLSGATTIEKLKEYQADYTFLGVFALSTQGLFIHTEEEGLVKRQMIKQGRTVIALADHTKLNKTGFFKICDLSAIDLLITDETPDKELLNALENNHVQLLIAKKE